MKPNQDAFRLDIFIYSKKGNFNYNKLKSKT